VTEDATRPAKAMAPAMASLRTQILLALLITLAIAVVATALIDRQVTDTRLRAEAESLLDRNLDVLTQLVDDTRLEQATALRTVVQSVQPLGLSSQTPTARLRDVAVDVRRRLGADGVVIADRGGRLLVTSGAPLRAADVADMSGRAVPAPRLVTDGEGEPVEVLSVPVGRDLQLLSSRRFGDTRAYAFRRVLGYEVALLQRDLVRGTTLGDAEALAAIAAGGPGSVEVVVDGRASLVGYADVGDGARIAIVTPQLLAGLQRDLTTARLLSLLLLLLGALLVGALLIRRITRPLVALSETADAIRLGEEGRTFAGTSDDEIGRLGQTLESMRQSLKGQLQVISLQSTTIRSATQRIVTARDVERRRIAQDLHDGVQQQLVMLRLRIGLLGDDLAADDRTALGREVEAIIRRLRETSQAIFPSILTDRGLTGALYSLAAASPVPVDLDLRPDPMPRVGEAVETGVYFIVAEAVTNVLKHADASGITVRLHRRPAADEAAGSVLLVVADDGKGVDPGADTRGMGLQNLRDRAIALGGVAHVHGVPGCGTAVAVCIPLDPPSVRGPLQEEQDRRHAAVEVVRVAEAELAEDGVGVLLDRALADDQLLGDR
jgi:signal transduction histidine kinase